MSLNVSIRSFGELRCRIIDALPTGTAPKTVVVLCHGFGAPGDDLAGFGPHLMGSSTAIADTCQFVFPEAPIDLTSAGLPGGRAWWPINMARLAEMHQTKRYDDLTDLEPPGMREAAAQLATAVREIQQACGLSDDATVLGGFSQGAMVSTDIVLRHGFVPRQLVLFSGTLLCREIWTAAAASHPGCSVLQSHGRQDMVLPFAPAEDLRDMLKQNGFSVSFQPFNGPHTIPPQVLDELVRSLTAQTTAQ